MRLLLRSSRRYLLRHPWQMGLSALGVAMAVAVVVGIDLANASAGRAFRLSVEGLPDHRISVVGRDEATGDPLLTVKADRLASYRVFVSAPTAALDGESTPIDFVARDVDGGAQVTYDAVFRGPGE